MKIRNSTGKTIVPLILIILFLIILFSIVIVIALNDNKSSDSEEKNVTEQEEQKQENKKEDDSFKEIEDEIKKDKKEEKENKEYLDKEGVNIDNIFDKTGQEDKKLHIGDFVDYTAGEWTEEEINSINANGKVNKPTENFQFGGYNVGYSRDRSVVPLEREYAYVKENNGDDGEKRAVRGWRIFDVTNNEIVLISAGCPEDYYHPESKRSAYISEYILTGEVNSNANAEWLELGTKYKARTWEEYVNKEYYAIKANTLTKDKLDKWYEKYIGSDLDVWVNTSFQKIYDTNYENLIDNYAYYWLSDSYNEINLYGFFPSAKAIGNSTNIYGNVFGIRTLVYLPRDIKFKEEPIGTKTVTSRDKDYEYNIWQISR